VQAPDKDDWNKLTHLMKYLRGTRSPRIPSSGQYFVPGHQECNSFGKELKSFEQQAYEAR
jgi:hypothetical protein